MWYLHLNFQVLNDREEKDLAQSNS